MGSRIEHSEKRCRSRELEFSDNVRFFFSVNTCSINCEFLAKKASQAARREQPVNTDSGFVNLCLFLCLLSKILS
jgi:hypothetical protein